MERGDNRLRGGRAGTWATAAVLTGLLGLAGFVAGYVWRELGDVALGLHGWLALGLGVGATAGLGVGLMMLLYHSHRHGYDDRAGRDD